MDIRKRRSDGSLRIVWGRINEHIYEGNVVDNILLITYFAIGYWAVGKTIYADKMIIGTISDMFLTKLIVGALLGGILIPVAIIKAILIKKSFFINNKR